ncbi:MAG: hypothetical protein IJA65_05990 [Acholeplasmatales bacterium]|nr:hypothetical protein [Acholeplasmatales bacterium]
MKTKYNLYASIASLCATLFLLVVIVMAWYVTNEEASATGITGSTAILDEESQGNVSEVYYFDITKVEDVTGGKKYTVSETCKGTKVSNIDMGKYDALYSEAHQLLMVIKLKDSSNYSINVTTDSVNYLGNTIKDSEGNYILKSEDNPISSVISFIYADSADVTLNETTNQQYGFNFPTSITTSSQEKSFVQEYVDDASTEEDDDKQYNDELIQSVQLSSSSSGQYLYIILDYVENAIEDIYSKNIGNDALNGISEYEGDYITYACDFKINIEKVEGGTE